MTTDYLWTGPGCLSGFFGVSKQRVSFFKKKKSFFITLPNISLTTTACCSFHKGCHCQFVFTDGYHP